MATKEESTTSPPALSKPPINVDCPLPRKKS